jgi:hypothetical protein
MGRRRDCAGKFGCGISLSPLSGPRDGGLQFIVRPYRRRLIGAVLKCGRFCLTR